MAIQKVMTDRCQYDGFHIPFSDKEQYTLRGPMTNWNIYHFCNFECLCAWISEYVRAEVRQGTMTITPMIVRDKHGI